MKSEDFFAVIAVSLGAVALVALIIAIDAIMYGWALVQLWHWFVLPIFGTPVPTLAQAIGLCAIASFLQPQLQFKSKDGWAENFGQIIGMAIIRPLFVVGFCWFVYQFTK